jgi:serine/threonine protein kinase
VHLVRRKEDDKKFALKQIEKKLLSQEKKEYQAMVERELLCRLDHPGIIKLNSSFTDPKKLYFVLEYCEGGQFKDFLQMHYGRLNFNVVAFYVGEIVNVLEYLHLNGIVHRDLKVPVY